MAMGTLLAAEVPTDIQRHVSLAPYTTTRVGGAADWFATVRSSRAVVSALGWAADRDLPLDVAVERAVAATRRFARRQRAWFRRDPRIRWVDATEEPVRVLDAVLRDWPECA